MQSTGDEPSDMKRRRSTDRTQGAIVPIGGAEDKVRSRHVLRRVLELSGGEQARVAVVPTASRVPEAGRRYCEVFSQLGAADSWVVPLKNRRDCGETEMLQKLRDATCIFMTGGNQLRLSTILGGTPVARLMRKRNAEGAVIAGTSAGAAIMSQHMIAYGREGSTPRAGMVSIVPGLGLVNRIIVDQHFRQRDRLGRLLTALAYNPFAIGVGLDEDTAAVVHPHRVIEVVGTNAVTIVDPSALSHSAMGSVREGEAVSLVGLTMHVLVEGGTFDMRTRQARAAEEDIDDMRESKLEAADRDVEGIHPDDGSDPGPFESHEMEQGMG